MYTLKYSALVLLIWTVWSTEESGNLKFWSSSQTEIIVLMMIVIASNSNAMARLLLTYALMVMTGLQCNLPEIHQARSQNPPHSPSRSRKLPMWPTNPKRRQPHDKPQPCQPSIRLELLASQIMVQYEFLTLDDNHRYILIIHFSKEQSTQLEFLAMNKTFL